MWRTYGLLIIAMAWAGSARGQSLSEVRSLTPPTIGPGAATNHVLAPATGTSEYRQLAPSTPLAPAEPAKPTENLVRFDPNQVDVQWVDNRWELVAGGKVLKEFGHKEMEARQALRIIRELGLTQLGTVGSPRPVLEYWLVNGNAPQ